MAVAIDNPSNCKREVRICLIWKMAAPYRSSSWRTERLSGLCWIRSGHLETTWTTTCGLIISPTVVPMHRIILQPTTLHRSASRVRFTARHEQAPLQITGHRGECLIEAGRKPRLVTMFSPYCPRLTGSTRYSIVTPKRLLASSARSPMRPIMVSLISILARHPHDLRKIYQWRTS